MKRRLFLLGSILLLFIYTGHSQKNLTEDKNLVNALLLCVSHGGYPIPLLVSPKADTAKLHHKLRVLGLRWASENYRRDSIKLNATFRLPIEGTKMEMVLVYFMYRNIEWDEMLLLINKEDGLLLDIANYGDLFYFKKYYRLRYHNNQSTLYNYFFPKHSTKTELQTAVNNIVRLALADKKDSLTSYIELKDTSFRNFKSLGKEWLDKTEKEEKEKLAPQFIKQIKESVASLTTLEKYGDFQSDTKKGTCFQLFKCKTKGRLITFYFIKKEGRYLLYKLYTSLP
jgi:hypothetical protein